MTEHRLGTDLLFPDPVEPAVSLELSGTRTGDKHMVVTATKSGPHGHYIIVALTARQARQLAVGLLVRADAIEEPK